MKNLIKILLLLLITTVVISCSDDNSSNPVNNSAESFDQLEIPNDFDWVTGSRVLLNVDLVSEHLNISLDGKRINLIDQDSNIITSTLINDMKAVIPAVIPESVENMSLQIPTLNVVQDIVNNGQDQNVVFELNQLLTFTNVTSGKSGNRVNPIGNNDFEVDVLNVAPNSVYVPAVDGEWYQHSAGSQTVDIVDDGGNNVLKFVPQGFLSQSINVNPNDAASFVFSIRNPDENFVTLSVNFAYYDINGDPTGTQAINLNSAQHDMDVTWTEFSTDFVIPADSETLTLSFHSHNFGTDYYYLDNFEYAVSPDDDGDGVFNDDDDYPNDPERAYRVVVPYTGRRIVAFEDLWPDKGDYDFNDMVIGTRFEYALNAQRKYVDLIASVRYRGLGASYHNGLGVRFINVANNGGINEYTVLPDASFVKDVSHNTDADPYSDNSIIVTGDVFQQINTYYQNNGIGPDGTPYERLFAVNFNTAAVQPTNLVEDFFIYQAGHRGREIHLPNRPATDGSDANHYMTGDDSTDPAIDYWYQTANGHPWGLEILSTQVDFLHPREYVPITRAYPEFAEWAESGGNLNTDWYLTPISEEVYSFSK